MSLAALLEYATRELERIAESTEPEECKPARVVELCREVLTTLTALNASREEASRIASLFDAATYPKA